MVYKTGEAFLPLQVPTFDYIIAHDILILLLTFTQETGIISLTLGLIKSNIHSERITSNLLFLAFLNEHNVSSLCLCTRWQ